MFNRKKKNKSSEPKAPRFKEIRDAYKVTKAAKPWIGAAMAGIFLALELYLAWVYRAAFRPMLAARVTPA